MIYRLHSMQWPAGLRSGVPLLALDRRSPLQWCLAPNAMFLRVPSRLQELFCRWFPSTWTPHVRHLVSRGNRLFAQCVAWCKSERLPLRFASTLFTSYVLPSISWGSLPFTCSTPCCGVGGGSFWVGRLVPPSHLSSWSLVGQMLSTSPLVGCLSLVGCTQCLRATDVHFLL